MKSMKVLMAGSIVAGLAAALTAPVAAQTKAGVVTNLQGTANVQRVSTPQSAPLLVPLAFKSDVLVKDLVTTGDQSLVRLLLGGKAVVTVREHSSLTITDTGTTSTIDISNGKVALTVAKERMGPNDRIDIKTPNAVAGVRGTVVITEVTAPQGSRTPASGVTTRFTLLTGIIDVTLLDPTTGRPGASRFTLNPLQTLGITGFTPPAGPRTITRAQAQAAANDYKVQLKDSPQATNAQVSDRQVEDASNAAAATLGGSTGVAGAQVMNQVVTGGTSPKPYVRPEDAATKTGAGTTSTTTPITTPPCRSICEGARNIIRR